MSFTYQRIKRATLLMLGMMIAGVWLATPGLTADHTLGAKKQISNRVTIRSIRPIGEGSYTDPNLRPEQVFDVVGSLNEVDGNRIVIGDRELVTASGVNAQGISTGSLVGAKLDNSGAVVAIETISDEPH